MHLGGFAVTSPLVRMAAAGSRAVAGVRLDPYYANVSALLHLNGADGGTSFVDEKGHTFSAIGNAQLDTAQARFGVSSLLLDGVNDGVSIASNSAFGMSTGEFTVECWIRLPSNAASGGSTIFDFRSTTSDNPFVFYVKSNGGSNYIGYYARSTGSQFGDTTTTAIPLNTWTHVALTRAANTARLHVMGVAQTMTSAAFAADCGSTAPMRIGLAPDNTSDFAGWIDEVRITKGIARYPAGNFTPPVKPFPSA